MKRAFRFAIIGLCAAVCAINLSACTEQGGPNGGALAQEATALGTPKPHEGLTYQEMTGTELNDMRERVEAFSAKFTAAAYESYTGAENFAVAPISVYMALSLAAECASGDTRQELLSALDLSYETLQANFSTLYRSLAIEHSIRGDDGEELLTGRVSLGNSIWVNEGTSVKNATIQSLADNYFCHSYSADFFGNNDGANRAVQEFVKEQTHGLIDKEFKLTEETVFALINTLYLKDIWNIRGQDLRLTDAPYDFIQKSGQQKNIRLLQGEYKNGRVAETETYTHFFTSTQNGYKIKFILPKAGYTVDEVFTAENIVAVNAASYETYDEESGSVYLTRCLFPEYKAEYDDEIIPILQSTFGINDLFDPFRCDNTSLTDTPVVCSGVRHVATLEVNRKGIEGAAVTVMMDTATSVPSYIYGDFVVDRAFGFILTDRYDTVLFTGVVGGI